MCNDLIVFFIYIYILFLTFFFFFYALILSTFQVHALCDSPFCLIPTSYQMIAYACTHIYTYRNIYTQPTRYKITHTVCIRTNVMYNFTARISFFAPTSFIVVNGYEIRRDKRLLSSLTIYSDVLFELRNRERTKKPINGHRRVHTYKCDSQIHCATIVTQ